MKNTPLVKFLSSAKLLIALLIIISAASVIGTFIPQREDAQAYISRYGEPLFNLLNGASFLDLYRSWWYMLLLGLLALNILVCTMTRFKLSRKTAGIMAVHLSIIFILTGATMGAFSGVKGFMQLHKGELSDTFYTREDKPVKLGFSVKLDDFSIEWYEAPHFAIFLKSEDGSVKKVKFEKTGEEKTVEGTDWSIKVLKYIPDFSMDTTTGEITARSEEPNNPAVCVLLKNKSGEYNQWLFEKFPGFGQEKLPVKLAYQQAQGMPKDYKSALSIVEGGKTLMKKTIEVNHPLAYKGYAFYQSSYDSINFSWSGLQVTKDPGVPVVYTGFIILICGLSFIYFVKPYLK